LHHYGKPTYVAASYYTSYLKKIDKSITNEFWTIIKKCEDKNIDVNLNIKKLGNAFMNAQQMSAQLATYIILSLPLYHAFRSFSFLNTSLQLEHAFVLKWIALLKELP
jgi:23S rRNA pseudoU1915 N3-methylase RlmH